MIFSVLMGHFRKRAKEKASIETFPYLLVLPVKS